MENLILKVHCKSKLVLIAIIILQLFGTLSVYTQKKLDGFEFVDRELTEILYALSMYKGISICGDDTVTGKATFRAAGKSFEDVFDNFLQSQRLYVTKTNDIWTVSKVRILNTEEVFSLDVFDITPAVLVDKLSSYFNKEVTFDILPDKKISLHSKGNNLLDFVDTIVRQLGKEYSIEIEENHIHIKYLVSTRPQKILESEFLTVYKQNDNYTIDISKCSVCSVIEKLFAEAKKQFVMTGDCSQEINRIHIENKSFNEIIELLCAQTCISWINDGEIDYFIGGQQKKIIPEAGRIWKTYSLSFKKTNSIIQLLLLRFNNIETVLIPDEEKFLCLASDDQHLEIEKFICEIDKPHQRTPITLQYIRTSDLQKNLPPDIDRSSIMPGTDDNVFFFTGSQNQYDSLKDALTRIDVPVKRVRYDLLVIQYDNSDKKEWNASVSGRRMKYGDRNDISYSLGSVLDLNMNVVTTFGLQFALSLQNQIDDNTAHVFADTTLQGVSGGTINFRNANIFRYRDNNVDPETGKPVYSGITREISSGLKIDITGWVSGDGMITSKVNASVTKQGADLSSKTGNPPPTSERVITTEVRGRSGEPVVLSGLIQNEESVSQSRIPFVSRIPLLGYLFKSQKKIFEKTEMVIYLVPHWEKDESKKENNSTKDEKIECEVLFQRLLKSFLLSKETALLLETCDGVK